MLPPPFAFAISVLPAFGGEGGGGGGRGSFVFFSGFFPFPPTHTHRSTNFFLPHPKSIVHPPPPPSETHESRPPKLPRRCCYHVRNLCAHASFSRLFTNISSIFISTGCSYRGLPLSARPAGRAGAPGIGRHTGIGSEAINRSTNV